MNRPKEAHELGDAVVRMMRALVVRAGEGDTIAVEQLQRVATLAPAGLQLGVEQAHSFGYSWATLGDALGSSRQNAQQLAEKAGRHHAGAAHVLRPGHRMRDCTTCQLTKAPA